MEHIFNEKIKICKILKTIRKSLGLTQEQVADKLDLAPRYISDIERDKTKGSLDTLVKFCNIYNVSPIFNYCAIFSIFLLLSIISFIATENPISN